MEDSEIKFIITDVDGVIFDRMPIFQSTFAERMQHHYGIPAEFSRVHYYETAGVPLQGQIKELLAAHDIGVSVLEIDELVKEFNDISRRSESKLFPGVAEVLRKIKASDRHLLASSGSPTRELCELFIKHDLSYDFVLGSDGVCKGDKHIDLFAKYFRMSLESFCQQAILIGDGPVDMGIAKRNGIFAVGITNTVSAERLLEAGADIVISDIAEVLRLCGIDLSKK